MQTRQLDTLKISEPETGILQITLNRPDCLNALNQSLLQELDSVLKEVKNSSEILGILLTGEGKAFCAGADIKQLSEANYQTGFEFAKTGQQVFNRLENLGKPSVSAVNGMACGGGCELAMATSLRIGSAKAQFGQPEVKLGVIPGYGGTQRLSRLVGKGRALDLCLTGRFIQAEEALTWGLITQLTSPDDLITNSLSMLSTICSMAPEALKSVMKVIQNGFDMTLEDSLYLEALEFARCCGTEDKKEGVSAFLEKRKAVFTGK